MKTNPKLLLVILGLITYTSANAAGVKPSEIRLHVLECTSEVAVPETATKVTIDQILKKRGSKNNFEAKVYEREYDMRFVTTFAVKEKKSKELGSPRTYKGKGFELEIPVLVPVSDRLRANLVADTQKGGGRISENMLCRFLR